MLYREGVEDVDSAANEAFVADDIDIQIRKWNREKEFALLEDYSNDSSMKTVSILLTNMSLSTNCKDSFARSARKGWETKEGR